MSTTRSARLITQGRIAFRAVASSLALLLAVSGLLAGASPARAEWLVLVGGTWIHTQGPWVRQRDVLRVETVGGLKMQFRMYQIDPEATRKLNEVARATSGDPQRSPGGASPSRATRPGQENRPGDRAGSPSPPDARRYLSNLNALVYCASVYKYDDLAFETCFRTH